MPRAFRMPRASAIRKQQQQQPPPKPKPQRKPRKPSERRRVALHLDTYLALWRASRLQHEAVQAWECGLSTAKMSAKKWHLDVTADACEQVDALAERMPDVMLTALADATDDDLHRARVVRVLAQRRGCGRGAAPPPPVTAAARKREREAAFVDWDEEFERVGGEVDELAIDVAAAALVKAAAADWR
mgnify:CR=1 FL=1